MDETGILAEIAELERAVEEAVAQAGGALARGRTADTLAAAVLAVLDDADLDELAAAAESGELARAVDAALDAIYGTEVEEAVRRAVTERTVESVRLTAEFYNARGLSTEGIADAVRRSEVAQQLDAAFAQTLQSARGSFYEGVREDVTRAALTGAVSRDTLLADLQDRAGLTLRDAAANAETATSAYTQAWRNQFATTADLDHFLYSGTLIEGSRAFCRAHIDRVFTSGQIAEMDNGNLNPVALSGGGWRCRHSWLAVDPEWDEGLAASVVEGEAATINLDRAGNTSISVVMPAGHGERLQRQIELARRHLDGGDRRFSGYIEFEDTSDTGFIAVHRYWRARYDKLNKDLRDAQTPEEKAGLARALQVMDEERDAARILAARGDEVLLPDPLPGKRGGPCRSSAQ